MSPYVRSNPKSDMQKKRHLNFSTILKSLKRAFLELCVDEQALARELSACVGRNDTLEIMEITKVFHFSTVTTGKSVLLFCN